jgi:cell wall-associated NlpC family hydrolase
MGGAEVRKKIVEYANKAVSDCAAGKAFYDQHKRYKHDENAIDGVNWYDCSSLVEAAYQYAGVTGISGTTATEYPQCLDVNGGLLIPVSQMDKALAGDMIWFYKGTIPDDQAGMQNVDYGNSDMLYHVGIYIGNGQFSHAHGMSSTPNILTSNVEGYQNVLGFGRPKDLIDLDKVSGNNIKLDDPQLQKLADAFDAFMKNLDPNGQSPLQGQGATFCAAAKQYGVSPFFIMSIPGQESTWGTNGNLWKQNNVAGLTGKTSTGKGGPGSDGRFDAFDQIADCIYEIAARLASYGTNDVDEHTDYKDTHSVLQMQYHYCPPDAAENHGSTEWSQNIYGFAKKFSELSGVPLDIRYDI